MPETAIITKSISSLNAPKSSREETNHFLAEKRLARCIQRKFQKCSQLPIRCQKPGSYYRPPKTSFRLTGLTTISRTSPINTAKSCPDNSTCNSIFCVIGTPCCRKSLSMSDLSPSIMEAETGDLRSNSSSTTERIDEGDKVKDIAGNDIGITVGIKNWMDGFVSEEGGSRFFQNPEKAANLVCRVLMLNAWRRRRKEILGFRRTIDNLNQQVKNLHLQIIVLRRLLDTENGRVCKLTNEVRHVRTQFDETLKEKDALKTETEKMEGEIRRLSELSEERLVTAENVRNELLTVQAQLQSLDEQLSKDREKLLKLREDKKILLEKVTASETLAVERGARADKAESVGEELQMKLATQIGLVESLKQQIQQYAKELKSKEEEKSKLEKRLKSSEETGRSLHLRTVFLETQLADRETTLRRVESSCISQLAELNELRERLIRQSQEGGWSSRMLQLAGSVVRAPRAILRTLLSSTGPVLTS
ncbi:A-kinase anchor protein 9-like [Osmia bicornis bicornis]|uniref:A-kinase anchor protein 9-like n=1 Tax=Osmia bicornis bicornis TaxID=1437191 RepID=UPI001EAF46F5|nr:A-kinase anchor protein 9-like [Osmia bicornis bicornis]XP_046140952.1 A-kinase anchor protein 9-like [Osmia bicornis bicornis]